MKTFMCHNFLLSTETAKSLYHDYAKQEPIYDYHSHINPRDIAEDRQFKNLTDIWLEGDHYKWRAMRTAGFTEELITGNAADKDKYDAWAKTVPLCIGNPIYHWTHLELRRPFGISNTYFSPKTADDIWQQTKEQLTSPEFSARGILKQMQVKMVGTTDDPTDSLEFHKQIIDDKNFDIEVSPSWRPDRAFKPEHQQYPEYLQKLGQAADIEIINIATLLVALERRIQHFADMGCRSADHGIEILRYAPPPGEKILNQIIEKRLNNQPITTLESAQFSTTVQIWLAQQYCKRGWVMQMHIGAQRNNSSRLFNQIGADAGADSISDLPFSAELGLLLDAMDMTNNLPQTILYCLNPSANEMIAAMTGNFQSSGMPGKIQFGSGWWFNDQKDGMERQLEQLSQMGLLSQFVGMLTDSRSFLSYTRHEYFRRILCEKIGNWVENGEAPNDLDLLGSIVKNICYGNAKRYFELPK